MAEEFESRLGFDATEALKTLRLLETVVGAYTRALKSNTTATSTFNNAQRNVDSSLSALESGAKSARQEVERLARAQEQAARAAKKQQDIERVGRSLDARKRTNLATQELTRNLGIDRTGAAIPDLVRVDDAIAQFRKLVQSSGATRNQVARILGNLEGEYRGASRSIRNSIVRIIQAQARLGGENLQRANALLGQLGAAGEQAGQRTARGMREAKIASDSLLLSWQSVTRIFVGQLVFRGIAQFSEQLRNSVNTARELQIALTEIQTIAPPDLRNAQIADVGNITRDISNQFGINQVETANALYETFSNQVGNTAESVQFLNTVAGFSKATLTDMADAGDLVSSVLNAYNLEVENAADISDKLFKTIDLGRIRGEELANTLGRVTPLASQLGVSLEEVFAALQTTTIQGTTTNKAITQLQNVMKGLVKPTTDLRRRFDELGVSTAEVGIARFGLVGFIDEIRDGADSVEQLSRYFNDVRELRGVLSLAAQDGALFAKNLRETRDEAEGVAKAAEELALSSPAAQLQKSIEAFQNTLTDDVGNAIVDFLNQLVAAFGGGENAAKVMTAVIVGGITAIGTAITVGAIPAVLLLQTTLVGTGSVAALAFGPVGIALAALVVGLGSAGLALNNFVGESKNIRELTKELNTANEAAKNFSEVAITRAQNVNKELQEGTKETANVAIDILSDRLRATQTVRDAAERSEKAITSDLQNQLQERSSAVDRFVKDVENSIQRAAQTIKANNDDLRDFELRINQDRFDRNVQAEDDPRRQANLFQNRIDQLLEGQRRAASAGETDFAKRLNDEALRLANRLADISGQRSKGESEINRIFKSRQNLISEINSTIEEQAKANQSALRPLERQQTLVDDLRSKFQSLVEELRKGDLTGSAREEIQTDLTQTATQLQEALRNFGNLGVEGFDREIERIQRGFRTLSDQQVPLNFAIDQGLQSVKEQLDQTRFSVPIELEIQNLTGIAPGPDQASQLQKEISDLVRQIETNRDNSVGLAGSLNQLRTQRQNIQSILNTLNQEATSLPDQAPTDIFGNALFPEGLENRKQAVETLTRSVEFLKQQTQEAFRTGDTAILDDLILKIDQFRSREVDNEGLEAFNTGLQQLVSSISAAQAAIEKVQISRDAQQRADELDFRLNELTQTLQQTTQETTRLGPSAAQSMNQAAQGTNNYSRSLEQATQRLQQLRALQNQRGGPVQNQSSGGPVRFFNQGGFTPRGTDTVPAMLSPGEFVVNAASSRKFFSELVSINAGQRPVYREAGGPVSTNNFTGDININLPQGSNQNTGREAANAIRRELRRKTSKL